MSLLQKPLFLPESTWQLPDMGSLPSWQGAERVGFDVETCDPSLNNKLGPGAQRDGYVVGFCVSIEDGPSLYLPVRHAQGTNLALGSVRHYVRTEMKNYRGLIVGANLSYDIDYLCSEFDADVWELFPNIKGFIDTQINEPLIDENQYRFGLDALAARYGIEQKDEELLRHAAEAFTTPKGKKGHRPLDAKKDLWRLDPKYVGAYGEWDGRLPMDISRKQEEIIEAQGLTQIWELERKVLPALVRMKRRGVAVDFDRMDQIERWIIEQETIALKEVYRYSGKTLDIEDVWQPDAMAPVLFGIGASLRQNAKNKQWKIDDDVLKGLKHPVGDALSVARKVNKVRRDFIRSIRQHAVNGRIHCQFNQLKKDDDESDKTVGTVSGRLSATHPNMQQQPSPKDTDPDTMGITDELALMWRSIYVADEGGEWACLDYSQQEPRILHHYAELTGCPGAKAACERYRSDLNTDNHSLFAEMTGLSRKKAKTVYLGKCYRMGKAKFALSLGLPTQRIKIQKGTPQERWIVTAGDEAQEVLKQFSKGAPYIDRLADKAEARARKNGFITTLLGRHCHFDKEMEGGEWTGNYLGVHKALNRLIQGSAADQTKLALVEADKENIPVQLQVHDELDFTRSSEKESDRLAEIMRECVVLQVPSKVDVEVGPNWGDIN